MLDGLRFALSTLTVLPVRAPRTDRATVGRAMELAPVAGLVVGLVAAAVLLAARLVFDTDYLASILAIATLALMTRGLHLDGLADLADGLGSHRDPAGTRQVMKDPAVGAFGVLWLLFVPFLQISALTSCTLLGSGTASLLLAVVTGRVAITAACRSAPPAAATGMGALVAGTVRRGVPWVWFVGSALAFAGYAFVDQDTRGSLGFRVARTVVAPCLALLVAAAVRRHAVRRVGGVTGDVLGALCELATTVCLVVLSVPGPHQGPP
ncbi:MAG: cobalamin-5-phosphate synthase CobS [Frankiales bacterium]|nr:cobalamin-5-phosphate synthase CobS [Frankiales bacterium]